MTLFLGSRRTQHLDVNHQASDSRHELCPVCDLGTELVVKRVEVRIGVSWIMVEGDQASGTGHVGEGSQMEDG